MASKKKLTDAEILAIITQELTQASSFGSSTSNTPSTQVTSVEEPLAYYLGLPNGTEVEGRSKITSTDVADAIEWIMPEVMNALTSTNEVVVFDATSPDDEDQADLESEYVYDILMKQNDGFVILHQFVKEALLNRNGIIKVYYEEKDDTKTEDYSGLTAQELEQLIAPSNIEVLAHSSFIDELTQQASYSVRIAKKAKCKKICVESIPLENFRISSDHNSISPAQARFTSHDVVKTASELRKMGVPQATIDEMSPTLNNQSSYRFDLQGESTQNFVATDDKSLQQYRVHECYMLMDADGDGIAELMQITVAGEDSPSKVLTMNKLDSSPWIACAAILMSHKFQGLSIYDRLKTIQDHKTAIWRNILDNMYLQNNQRNKVIDGQVNLDDLAVSRPGGIIRMKRLDAIAPLETPMLSDVAIQMLQMLDETKAGRVGVSADGTSAPQNIGERVGSEGVDQLMSAKQALVGLIIKVIAETGVKPLCIKIRELARNHVDTIQDYKFKGQWVQVNPSQWMPRTSTTVRVGTGSGDKSKKLAAINSVLQLQTQLATSPLAYLVDDKKAFNTINDFCKFSSLSGATRYFYDPASPEGIQAKKAYSDQQAQTQQKEEQKTIAELQIQQQIAQSALQTSQAQMANVQLKAEVETAKNQLAMQKAAMEAKISQLEAMLKQAEMAASTAKTSAETEYKYEELESKTFIELAKINAQKDLKLIDVNAKLLESESNDNEAAA